MKITHFEFLPLYLELKHFFHSITFLSIENLEDSQLSSDNQVLYTFILSSLLRNVLTCKGNDLVIEMDSTRFILKWTNNEITCDMFLENIHTLD